MIRLWRLTSLLALVLTGALLPLAVSSAQTIGCDVTADDPDDDGSGPIGPDGKSNDIREVCAGLDGGTLEVAIRDEKRGTAEWSTTIVADGRVYVAAVEADGNGLRTVVTDFVDDDVTCIASASTDEQWRYMTTIDLTDCLGGSDTTPLWVRVDTNPGGFSADAAPNSGGLLVAEGDGDGDGDASGDGPLDGGCTTSVADPADGGGRSDLLEACAEYDGDTLDLGVRSDALLPYRAWSAELVIDDVAFEAVFQEVGNELLAQVVDEDRTPLCSASPAIGPFDGRQWIRNIDLEECFGATDLNIGVVWDLAGDVAPNSREPVTIDGGDGTGVLPGPGQDPEPEPDPEPTTPSGQVGTERLAGAGRMETAVAISQYQFPDGADEVYLANAGNFPDALAGGSLTRGPVLLVPGCGDLPRVVADEVERLGVDTVVVLGGTAAVCDDILDQAAAAAEG